MSSTDHGGRPLRSMTGWGDAEHRVDAGSLRAELRTVNHRFLHLQLRTPPGFERWHPAIERVLRASFTRGNVSLTLSLDREEVGSEEEVPAVEVDLPRARGYVEAFRTLQRELELPGEVALQDLLGLRELFQTRDRERARELPEVSLEEVEAVVERAAAACLAMREQEGARLAEDLLARLRIMEAEVERIDGAAPARLERERDRIRDAVTRLLPEGRVADEERIAREIAHMAERWDIHEEVVRFRSHLTMFRDTVHTGSADGVGKRLGFIVQEILREANTMGSKANDAEIARGVVALKEEIERLREQLENLE